MELHLRGNVEADVSSLRRTLEELNMQRQDLEIQVRCLQEELLQLKSNHEEVEMTSLKINCKFTAILKHYKIIVLCCYLRR